MPGCHLCPKTFLEAAYPTWLYGGEVTGQQDDKQILIFQVELLRIDELGSLSLRTTLWTIFNQAEAEPGRDQGRHKSSEPANKPASEEAHFA